jgi:hypothetical protein
MLRLCRAFKKEEKNRQDGLSSWAAFDLAEQKHHQSAKICCCWAAVLLAVAIAADAIQVLAIIALQHCHHEALLGLYWPVWTLLGLGSSIAMAGVVLSQIYGLQQHELPPFGTALGTPVLVVCSIGHYIYTQVLEWRKKKNKVSGTGSRE